MADQQYVKKLYPTKQLIIREYLLANYKLEQELLEKLLRNGGD